MLYQDATSVVVNFNAFDALLFQDFFLYFAQLRSVTFRYLDSCASRTVVRDGFGTSGKLFGHLWRNASSKLSTIAAQTECIRAVFVPLTKRWHEMHQAKCHSRCKTGTRSG